MPSLGPTELILILTIIVIFFGVGRLPEVFGSVGKGLREFRKAASAEDEDDDEEKSSAPESSKPSSENEGGTE